MASNNVESYVNANDNQTKKLNAKSFWQVEKYLTPSLILLAMFLLVIGSFFIGAYVSGGAPSTSINGYNAFDFFGKIYYDISKVVLEGSQVYIDVSNALNYGTAVMGTISILCNIVVNAVLFIFAIIAYVKNLNRGEQVNLLKYFKASLITFAITMVVLSAGFYGVLGVAVTGEVLTISVSVGSVAKAMFTIACLVLGYVIVVKLIKKGNKLLLKENIVSLIFNVIFTTFAIIVTVLICSKFSSLYYYPGGSESYSGNFSAGSSLDFVLSFIAYGSIKNAKFVASLCYLFGVFASIIASALIIILTAKKVFGIVEENQKHSKCELVLNIASFVGVLTCFVLSVVSATSLSSITTYNNIATGYTYSLLAFIMSLAMFVLYFIKEKFAKPVRNTLDE